MDIPPPLPGPKKTSGLAIASLCLGIFAVLGGVILLLPTILAVVFGHLALSKIRKDPAVGGRGLAIGGLATGYGSIVSIVFIGLLAAMAIPAFQKVRENSSTQMMLNSARMIGGASQQCFLENEKSGPIRIDVDRDTGAVKGPLAIYVSTLPKGMEVVDNVIVDAEDGFSLRHPYVNGGREVEFDYEGLPITQIAESTGKR